jgi:hypothetical protein
LKTILDSVRSQTDATQWRTSKLFIPLAATWLNGKRWNDEVIADSASTQSGQWVDNVSSVGVKSQEERKIVFDRTIGTEFPIQLHRLKKKPVPEPEPEEDELQEGEIPF